MAQAGSHGVSVIGKAGTHGVSVTACYCGSKEFTLNFKGRRGLLSLFHTQAHKRASHAHTHTEANNGAIIMVTLVMTYFFDLNSPSVAMVMKNALQKCAYTQPSGQGAWPDE